MSDITIVVIFLMVAIVFSLIPNAISYSLRRNPMLVFLSTLSFLMLGIYCFREDKISSGGWDTYYGVILGVFFTIVFIISLIYSLGFQMFIKLSKLSIYNGKAF